MLKISILTFAFLSASINVNAQAAKAKAAKAKAAKITSAKSLADAAKATEARLAEPRLAEPRLGSAKLLADTAEESLNINQNPIIVGLKNSLECLSGRNRLAFNANFFLPPVTEIIIGGHWQTGSIKEGTVTQTYVGVSADRDLMFLSTISKSGQVIGHNLTLSFCEKPNPMDTALLSNDISAHQVDFLSLNGITINKDTSCGYGLIEAAINTVIVSRRIWPEIREYINPAPNFTFHTTFVKPNCI